MSLIIQSGQVMDYIMLSLGRIYESVAKHGCVEERYKMPVCVVQGWCVKLMLLFWRSLYDIFSGVSRP